jgi:hypothetical protein
VLLAITETTTEEEKWSVYYASLSSRKMQFTFKGYESNFRILDYENLYDIEEDTLAVYGLKNAFSTILNIGASGKVRSRTIQKYLGKTSGSIADMYFKDFYCGGVKVCYVSSYVDVLLLEMEYINIYKPILNYYKAFYDTGIYKYLIKEYKKIDTVRWSRRKPIHNDNFKPTVEWIENLGNEQFKTKRRFTI